MPVRVCSEMAGNSSSGGWRSNAGDRNGCPLSQSRFHQDAPNDSPPPEEDRLWSPALPGKSVGSGPCSRDTHSCESRLGLCESSGCTQLWVTAQGPPVHKRPPHWGHRGQTQPRTQPRDLSLFSSLLFSFLYFLHVSSFSCCFFFLFFSLSFPSLFFHFWLFYDICAVLYFASFFVRFVPFLLSFPSFLFFPHWQTASEKRILTDVSEGNEVAPFWDVPVPQVDVQDIVPPAREEMVEVVQVTPHERGQERIAEQSDAVPPDKEEIAEVIQLVTKLSEFF